MKIESTRKSLAVRFSEINDRIQRMRRDLEKSLRVTWVETFSHPEVTSLVEESMGLYREMAKLEGQLIRENLARFGIEDSRVTAKVEITAGYDGAVIRTVEVGVDLLSNFCLPFSLWPKVELDKSAGEKVKLWMLIFLGEERIGYINSDGQFNFTAAPDLRVCVGWAVASDYGREKVLDYDLSFEVNKLEYAIKMASPVDGTHEEDLKKLFFEGAWKRAIVEVMQYKKGSRFCNGYCGVTTMFWEVATRTIRGREHPAFPFFY